MTQPVIRGSTRIAAVLGWPVEHTRSPAIMNAAFASAGLDAVLVPIGVPPDDLPSVVSALRAMRVLGASVTVPHKIAVAALCDELGPEARATGAVNCLVLDGGKMIGHNTDAGGFHDGLVAAGYSVRGTRCVLLGAGGAARAVAYALRDAGAIEVVARRPSDVTWATASPWTDEQLRESFARADLVVDCTPAGLDEATDARFAESLPIDALPPKAWVATLVYHRRTQVLERARARGHSVLDGKPMLVHQAARAFALWTGRAAPVEEMTRALDASLAR